MDAPGPSPISSWQEAELNAAAWMKDLGMRRVALTGAGADGGIDVDSYDGYAQVKWRAGTTGRPEIQALVGAGMGRRGRGLFFTGSSYSRAAVEYADKHDLALFSYDYMGLVRPVNTSATSFMRKMREIAAETAGVEEDLRAQITRELSDAVKRYLDSWDFQKRWGKSGGPAASAAAGLSFIPVLGFAIYGIIFRPAPSLSFFWVTLVILTIFWWSRAAKSSKLRGAAEHAEHWSDVGASIKAAEGRMDMFDSDARYLAKLSKSASRNPARRLDYDKAFNSTVERHVNERFPVALKRRAKSASLERVPLTPVNGERVSRNGDLG